jgi:hypothetical protein
VVRHILISKCFSYHNGVHFFFSISKSGPNVVYFAHFALEMRFAPYRRAIFYLSSGQLTPYPPLLRTYFSTLGSLKLLEKYNESRFSYLFTYLYLLSSFFFYFFSFLYLFPTLLFIYLYVGNLISKFFSIIIMMDFTIYFREYMKNIFVFSPKIIQILRLRIFIIFNYKKYESNINLFWYKIIKYIFLTKSFDSYSELKILLKIYNFELIINKFDINLSYINY